MQVSKSHKVVRSRVGHDSQDARLHGQRGLDLGLELSSFACLLDGIVHEAGSLGGGNRLSRAGRRRQERACAGRCWLGGGQGQSGLEIKNQSYMRIRAVVSKVVKHPTYY